jgi:FtsP/CotA-like multicopper oxidase with cupredoxin domain
VTLKRVLAIAAALIVLVLVGLGVAVYAMYSNARVSTVGELRFSQQLRIPPLLDPAADASGRKAFDLRLQEGARELLPGTRAQTWGVNGPYLGPTLRAGRGDVVQMNVRNDLPEASTVHWHGMHLPAHADGGPHQMIEPGEGWRPSWRVDQPATTLWYHPHPHGRTEDHVYRGLAGMFIVDDPRSRSLGLPDDYGVDDIPLIVQDPSLTDEGRLDFGQRSISPIGRLGDRTLVNGTLDPYLPVSHRRVRLRLLNASTARIYDIGFTDGREVQLIAGDGGLLESPRSVRRVRLSPGDRAEVVAEFRPGERAVLRSFEPDLGTDFFNERFAGGDDSFDLLQVRAEQELTDSPGVPARLGEGDGLDPADSVRTRHVRLSGSSAINGRSMEMDRIDEVVARGTTEVWEVENSSGIPHNFHPHDVRFRVLAYTGGPVPRDLAGLQDTVLIPPNETVRLVTRFEDYADPDTPYMFHCHFLEHEDRGMMGQFVVMDRLGDGAERRAEPHHGH